MTERLKKLLLDTENYLIEFCPDQKGAWNALIEEMKKEIVKDTIQRKTLKLNYSTLNK